MKELKKALSDRLYSTTTDYGDISFSLHGNGYEIYYGISSDDILDYSISENLEGLLDYINSGIQYHRIFDRDTIEPLSDDELDMIKRAYFDNIGNAKHRDYYDAYDNTWKDYE